MADHLSKEGIPFGVYYPKPIHQQPAFQDVASSSEALPVTEDLTHRVLSLPMHTELTPKQQELVCDAVLRGVDAYL